MRLKLTLHVQDQNPILPLNYQYPVSAWIYKILNSADADFTEWLHNTGYTVGHRHFKLFTFSNLTISRYKRKNDRLKILSPEVLLHLSFFIDKAAENFITGLFMNQEFVIGDSFDIARFYVQTVESLPLPNFQDNMEFKCLSPICLSRTVERNGRKLPEYISPDDSQYQQYFFDNLINKYKSTLNHKYNAAPVGDDYLQNVGKLEILSPSKSRLLTIKEGTSQQSRVRGYLYRFRITAPPELISFGYLAGFGEKNSLGFGCVEAVF